MITSAQWPRRAPPVGRLRDHRSPCRHWRFRVSALAALVDGIVVVADAKHTDCDEVEQVRIQFDQVGGRVVGAVTSNAAG